MSQESVESHRNEKPFLQNRLLQLHGNSNHHKQNYFIKREFLTKNPVNKGISVKLTSDDLKHYIEHNHLPNPVMKRNMTAAANNFNDIIKKFFI